MPFLYYSDLYELHLMVSVQMSTFLSANIADM
jgi:hypothetical protein